MADRTSKSETSSPQRTGSLSFAAFRLDQANGILWRGDEEVPLAPRPLAVLCYLLRRPGDVVSKAELLNNVWSGVVVEEATLSETIKVLRKALGDRPRRPTYIQTVHRRGYRFIAEVVHDPTGEAHWRSAEPEVVDSRRPRAGFRHSGAAEPYQRDAATHAPTREFARRPGHRNGDRAARRRDSRPADGSPAAPGIGLPPDRRNR